MAKTTITHVTDDMSGESDAQTYSFSLQGTEYSIDLADKNAAKLDKALAPFIAKATKVSGGRRKSKSSIGGKRTDLGDVRAWATQNGYQVSSRGRIPADVLAAYDAK